MPLLYLHDVVPLIEDTLAFWDYCNASMDYVIVVLRLVQVQVSRGETGLLRTMQMRIKGALRRAINPLA